MLPVPGEGQRKSWLAYFAGHRIAGKMNIGKRDKK
jgi:hypothetical protein